MLLSPSIKLTPFLSHYIEIFCYLFYFRTVVDLANSLSSYALSEGRRPDLKVIDDIEKPDTNCSGDGLEKMVTNSLVEPTTHLSENKLNTQENSFCLSYKGNSDQDFDSSISDNSDLVEENILFRNQKVKPRPAFNCKKKLIAHFK
jgi:hypothetical protein